MKKGFEKYRIAFKEGSRVVAGKPINIDRAIKKCDSHTYESLQWLKDIELFIHRPYSTGIIGLRDWVVSEKRTGRSIATATTQKDAIVLAVDRLMLCGEVNFKDQIKQRGLVE